MTEVGFRHVSVNGKVYPCVNRAAKELKINRGTLTKWANSDKPEHAHVFFVEADITLVKMVRNPNGTLAKGSSPEGIVLSKEHKANLRQAALKRAERDYRAVSVRGVIYPNLTRAGKALGLDPTTVAKHANSTEEKHSYVFFVPRPADQMAS